MRLIDADKLIEKLRDFKEWENDDGRPIHTMSEIQRIDRCINFAQTEPTAYDINKVVKELEERTDFLKDCTKYGNKNAEQQAGSYSTMMMYEVADLVDDLIEIVKRGGAFDDVCEWKRDNMCEKLYEVCGGYFTSAYQKNFKYCPYCGKKIKVVE